jgi:phosphatidylinositol-3-phosphatase
MEENHSFSDIIGNNQAPYINMLADHGADFTNIAISHPSEPNYFALFSGSTWGIPDDNNYNFPGPTLAGELNGAGKTFVGYIDSGSPRHHNPWESFVDSRNVEQPFSSFPSDFTQLPLVSWVIPNLNNDMHDGSIQQGDQWLQSNLSAYATWAQTHNSLLIVTWDEDDNSANNQVPAIFYGANLTPGQYGESADHYSTIRTIEDMYGLTPLADSASATAISDVWACNAGASK